jgi:hypothetical protein
MKALVEFPRVKERLKTHITTLAWEESVTEFEAKVVRLAEAGL